MKRIFTILTITMGLMLPMQAQLTQVKRSVAQSTSTETKVVKKAPAVTVAEQEGDVWVYPNAEKSRNPFLLESDKLYLNTVANETYLTETEELSLDFIAGTYTATAISMFDSSAVEWTVSITRDENDANKIWINPFCTINGASAYNSVYATIDFSNKTLTMPLGQTLYGSEDSEHYNLVIAGFDSDYNPVLSGNAEAVYEVVDGIVTISWKTAFGVGNLVDDSWWWQAVEGVTYTLETSAVAGDGLIISLNDVDSLSVVAPRLELMQSGIEKNGMYWSWVGNFNYDILTCDVVDGEKRYGFQGWFNNVISYKAYDSDNKLFVEDYVDIYSVFRNELEIPLVGFINNIENGNAYYGIDMFLPCDTAFKVAVTIPEGAIVWEGNTESVYEGVESYVDADGTRHGLVFDYYNERPRLLTTAEDIVVIDAYTAQLQFSECVTSNYGGMVAVTYRVYRSDDFGRYTEKFTGTDFYLTTGSGTATISLPQSIELEKGDIVTISYDNWNVIDDNFARATPFSMESSVTDTGIAQGLYWVVEEKVERFFQDGTYNFESRFTVDGENYYERAIPFTISFVSDGYDMSQIFKNAPAPFTGTKWELNGLLSVMFDGTDQPFPGFSYKYQGSDGLTYEYITIIDPEDANYLPCVGTVAMSNGSEYHAYLGNLTDDGYLSPYWDFVLVDGQGNPEGAVEDLMGVYSLETPIIIIDQNEGTGQSPQWGIIVQFDELYLTRGGEVEATTYTVYKEPRTLENVTFTRPDLEKKVFMNK